MIEYRTGDILAAETEALVNTVNCVGVMGRGIALQFKKAFPENFKAYEAACRHGEVTPGRMFVYDTLQLTNPRYIINFPTKRHWKGKSRIEDIEAGLVALVAEVERLGIRSIAVPPLGSGLGGLDWSDVRPRIEHALNTLPGLTAIVYEPAGAPAADAMVKRQQVPKMTPARAVLVGLMQQYLGGLLDPFVSLLEVHKLMYFMQTAGEELKLMYSKGPYGPYSPNLRHLLNEMEGYYVSGFADGSDTPEKPLKVLPGAETDAQALLYANPDTRVRFNHVVDLVDGFETPFGLELLATVHWVATKERASTAEEAVAKTYAWAPSKQKFSQTQIQLAWDVLADKGWLSTGPRSR